MKKIKDGIRSLCKPTHLLWASLLPITGCGMLHETNYHNQRTTAKFSRAARIAETTRIARHSSTGRNEATAAPIAAVSGIALPAGPADPSRRPEVRRISNKVVQASHEQVAAEDDAVPVMVPPAPGSNAKLPQSRAELKVQTLTRTYPIDLPTALRLGDADSLQIAVAREQLAVATARLEGAEALWLPSITAGVNYQFHVGQIQRAPGQIIEQNRNSLGVSAGPNLSVDMANAIYEPLIQEQRLAADSAAARATTNDILFRIASAYVDLLQAHGNLAIAEEAQTNARELARISSQFAEQGVGLRSDSERANTELGQRDQQVIVAQERVVVNSATLAQLLRLDPQTQLVPLEKDVVPIELLADNHQLADLVTHALTHRPELQEQRALVEAACQRFQKAKYEPLIPSLVLQYQAGGFGGGPGAYFGSFSDREDLTAGAVWELTNLGFGNLAKQRERQGEWNQSQMRALRLADVVASEVVAAYQVVVARRKQVEVGQTTVKSALRSYDLNHTRIRGGSGLPIEVLQSIQALERSRTDYLQAVSSYNRAQFNLFTAMGNTPYSPPSVVSDADPGLAPQAIPGPSREVGP